MAAGAQTGTRAPRFRVPNNERAIISVGAEKLSTTLNCLSLTGGRIRAPRQFDSGTFAEMEMKTVTGRFTAAIELLGIANGNMQAFRFVQMEPVYQGRLRDALRKMQALGFGEKQPTKWDRLLNFTRGVWPHK